MCPDPQLLSIYLDGELPSPWKEKMQEHFSHCPSCKDKFDNFKRLQDLFKEDKTLTRTFIERVVDEPAEPRTYTEDELQRSKEKVWEKIEARQGYRRRSLQSHRLNLWQRKLSVPLPAAAVAAVIVLLFAVFWLNGPGAKGQSTIADAKRGETQPLSIDRSNHVLAAEMEKIDEIQGIVPAADMSGILQYLAPQNTGANIIILQLPESKNFSRSGEPAIIRAADFSDRQQQRKRRQR